MSQRICALGCLTIKKLFIFPSRKHDLKRRKLWLDFFDMEEPNIDGVFACEKHFSHLQTTPTGIRYNAVPDIPTICNATVHPFKRKAKNWRTNVIVVTPRDPEFTIYRHETGVFPQSLFNNIEASQPIIQMPIIKSVSCSKSSQTNTRLCGLVQISNIKEEYRLNCFYCNEIFPIEKWFMFVNHLKKTHFVMEEAPKMSKYISQDHDYTSFGLPNTESTVTPSIKINMTSNSFGNLLLPLPVSQQPNVLPNLLAKPLNAGPTAAVFKKSEITPPPLLPKPQSNDKGFNISLADQVVKLLNETILSPKFLQTEEDNILVIKNTGPDQIETSNFLKNLANFEEEFSLPQRTERNVQSKNSNFSTSPSKFTRPVYTLSNGLQDIPSGRNSLSQLLFPLIPKSSKDKLIQRRMAQHALKSINMFENVYKTVKKRYPNVVEFAHPGDSNANKANDQQLSKLTPLSRCLKRTISEATSRTKEVPTESTQIVFEYTPKEIVVSLLENMKKFPVLWEFHDKPLNKDYNKAIEKLCRVINNKWSLNITMLKMKRSINRILKFYRFMLPSESIGEFEDYFYKCTLFLPSTVNAIPRARCVYCCICFEKDSELRNHIIIRHKALKWPYKCQQCLERFRERNEYELHEQLQHYEEIFKCEICNKIFNRRHLLNKHVALHEKSRQRRLEASKPNAEIPNFACELCNKTYRSTSDLKRHIRVHHMKQTFKCHLCPKEFTLSATLKLHIKRHNNELNYICEVCGKAFVRKSYLDEHMQTHTGAKITCNICNLKLRKCSLSRHLRLVHVATEGTIEGTFRARCYRYRKFFGHISKRRRTETPRHYQCKLCNIPFDRLKQLKDHNKQLHFDVKKTGCKLCSVEFIHVNNLKRHYRDKHKLHTYQVFMLVDRKEEPNKVLAMTAEELDAMNLTEFTSFTQNSEKSESFFEQEGMHSDEIQDEIMKAVENLDKQEIKVDDDHSMHDFFTDLLKQ